MAVASFFNDVTLESVKKAYEYMGYAYFEKGDYNLNIFGIRNSDLQSSKFNDIVGVTYKVDGKWKLFKADATTDPGTYYRTNLMNVDGTAIMAPDQYRGAYTIGMHRGKYEALRQKKPMKYWRDSNHDGKLDLGGKVWEEIAYTNIHRATAATGGVSLETSNFSAGCQVIASQPKWVEFMNLAYKARDIFGSSFTYTLFTEPQFFCKTKDPMEGFYNK